MALTTKGLESLKPGTWKTETGHRGEGILRAKGSTNGARFYFRYCTSEGRYDDLPLGTFSTNGADGMTLAQAKARAQALRGRYKQDRNLRAALAAEQADADRQRAIEQAAAEAAQHRATLGALLSAYVAQLNRNGKLRVREVETALALHVQRAHPHLWALPAAEITADDCLAIVARVVEAGTLRQAGKLRSYLRAAFAAAIRARHDPRAVAELRAMRLSANPARDLATIEGSTKPRERALSVAELRAYWRHIQAMPDPHGALLRFHLLTGAQRIVQIARVQTGDFDADTQTLRMLDPKGRRAQPRRHDVPLIPPALDALRAMRGGALGPHLFTVQAGEFAAVYSTVGGLVRDVADAMAAAGELPGGRFTPGDLRRTVETRLAALGMGDDVRGQLQSHGLGGVQSKHYNRHSYLDEKRAALETLHRLLEGRDAGNVLPLRKAQS